MVTWAGGRQRRLWDPFPPRFGLGWWCRFVSALWPSASLFRILLILAVPFLLVPALRQRWVWRVAGPLRGEGGEADAEIRAGLLGLSRGGESSHWLGPWRPRSRREATGSFRACRKWHVELGRTTKVWFALWEHDLVSDGRRLVPRKSVTKGAENMFSSQARRVSS